MNTINNSYLLIMTFGVGNNYFNYEKIIKYYKVNKYSSIVGEGIWWEEEWEEEYSGRRSGRRSGSRSGKRNIVGGRVERGI